MEKINVIETTKETVEQDHPKDAHQNSGDVEIARKSRPIERMFCCHICGKMFLYESSMKHHIRVHQGYRYICRIDMCYKFSTSKQGLIKHQRIHTGVKPYVCQVCQRAFTQQQQLSGHSKIHSIEKPFGCAHCAYKACQKRYLTDHLRRRHQNHGFEGQSLTTSNNSFDTSAQLA